MKKVLNTVFLWAVCLFIIGSFCGCSVVNAFMTWVFPSCKGHHPGSDDGGVKYNVQATGKYSDGIMLPNLTTEQSELHILMSMSYDQIVALETENAPQPQVQATNIWKNAYGTDIVVDVVSEAQQTEWLSTAVASGTSPDIIPSNFPLWSARGLVANVDDEKFAPYLDLDDEELGFDKERMTQYNFQGHPQWAIVEEPQMYYTVYNRTKFEILGEKTPMDYYLDGDKWTWSQFVETAKAMTDADAGEYGFTGWMLFPYTAPYPMLTLDAETGQAALQIDNEKYVGWMTDVYNFYQRDQAGRRSYDLQNWRTTFPGGTDAMVFAHLSDYEKIVKMAKELESGEFGIAPYPIYDKGGETERITPASLWGYSISSGALHPEAAATYIRLEILVRNNIKAAHPGRGYLDTVLTEDEKNMLEKTANDKVIMEMILGIGDCYNILDTQLVPPIYYNANEASVQAEIDAVKPLLQAEIDDYNSELAE